MFIEKDDFVHTLLTSSNFTCEVTGCCGAMDAIFQVGKVVKSIENPNVIQTDAECFEKTGVYFSLDISKIKSVEKCHKTFYVTFQFAGQEMIFHI